MKNYYKILGVDRSVSNDDIKKVTKELIGKIKKSNMSSDEKRGKLSNLQDAYNFLIDYHSRRKLDDYLDSKQVLVPKVMSNPFGVFDSLNFFNNMDLPDISNMKISDNNKFYQHSSFITTKRDNDGNIVTEKKVTTNDNGKINENHQFITQDKDGNEIIKDIPKSTSKKSIKYKI
tara:strand:- start:4829 stop:5353 length:525 start_codon:yes stop_codon:yes gene_type:complete